MRPLGAQLRRLRLERSLSQQDVADRAQLNYKYVGRMELGKAEPGADVLVRLARALEIPIGEIFAKITPAGSAQRGLSPADLDALSKAMTQLAAVVNRIVAGEPGPLPLRAPRRKRR